MKFKQFGSKNKAIEALASRLAFFVDEFRLDRKITILVSGGNTPLLIYKELLTKYSAVDWSKCCFIMVDERYVPFESSRNNAGSCFREFVQQVKIEDFIYPDTRMPLEESTVQFSHQVKAILDRGGIDLALLGTAPDGHVASIFPNSEPVVVHDIAFACKHDSPEEFRVSLDLASINLSHEIWVMALGEEKQGICEKAKSDSFNLPVLCLDKQKTTWFCAF